MRKKLQVVQTWLKRHETCDRGGDFAWDYGGSDWYHLYGVLKPAARGADTHAVTAPGELRKTLSQVISSGLPKFDLVIHNNLFAWAKNQDVIVSGKRQ